MDEIFADWKANSKHREETSFMYVRSLKMSDPEEVDYNVKKLHDEVFEKIDCLQCGNCCKTTKPLLKEDDIKEISKRIELSIEETKVKYLELDEDNDWTFNTLPCPFLGANNECQIYSSRPKDCREFPHTNKSGFASRSYQVSFNTTVCPATYYIVENLKRIINKIEY